MEVGGLEYFGVGRITDPKTGQQEDIELKAHLDLCQMVLSLDQELSDEGYIYPRIEISEVAFTLHPDMFLVDAKGDLPLYRSHQFEEGIKAWMINQISLREKDFKAAMQLSEREIMQSFAFKHEINMDASAHSSLSETMSLTEDHALISYNTEFEGKDLDSMKKKLRRVDPAYSDEPEFMKDIQTIVDENYINYYLFNMFETDKVFSITEILFDYWPDSLMGGPTAIRALMSAQVWSVLFPSLLKTYKPAQKVDFRCGFSKELLKEGELSD